MKASYIQLILISILLLVVGSCAAGPNPSVNVPDVGGSVAGFWLGLWHGFIAPIALIVSFFTDSVHFYDVHNNGWPYNVGYFLGIACLTGGGSGAASCSSKKPKQEE